MGKRNYQPEEIVGLLRDADILRGKGKTNEATCRELGISEAVRIKEAVLCLYASVRNKQGAAKKNLTGFIQWLPKPR